MRVNENIALIGQRVILVPYREEHVKKYHEWMSDPVLRELTASEPLTLEEEYEMQRKWQVDEDKLTFIVLSREETSVSAESGLINSENRVLREEERDVTKMIGDVNLFFKGSSTDEDFEVEAEIMIAESAYRRQGYASEALQLLFQFALSYSTPPSLPIKVNNLVVRLGDTNDASRRLFENLGFIVTKHVAVFGELEMRPQLMDEEEKAKGWVRGIVARYM